MSNNNNNNSNNNNNNNNNNFENLSPLEFVDKYEKLIVEINIQIYDTNEVRDTFYEQLIEFKSLNNYLINNRNIFIDYKDKKYDEYVKERKKVSTLSEKLRYDKLINTTFNKILKAKIDKIKFEKNALKIAILVPSGKIYEIDNGILRAKRDINIKLMAKLKNEKDMREFAGISGEYSIWKNHFLFKKLRNSGSEFSQPFDINHPQKMI
jgi:hypothetical protein